MKKILTILLILLLSQVCFAGRLQEMQKAVIAAKNGATPPAGPSKVAYDNFTDDDTTELSTHTSDSSHTWTARGTSTLVITSNTVSTPASAGFGYYYSSYTPASADYTVIATSKVNNAGGVNPLIGGRCSTSQNTMYYAYYNAGNYQLSKIINGTITSLGTYSGASTDPHVIKLEMVGTAIKVYVDDVERISVTDGDITAAGRPGIGAYYAQNTATYYLDTYEVWE